jgi:hypothetical protein
MESSEHQKYIYNTYSKEHFSIKKRNAQFIPFIIVFVLCYLITQCGWFLIGGIVYLLSLLVSSTLANKKLFSKYKEIDKNHMSEIRRYLLNQGIANVDYEMAFGYLISKDNFEPVFLCRSGNCLYQFKNIFIKHIVYGVDSKLIYLMDVNYQALKNGFRTYYCNHLQWTTFSKRHQQLLYEEGIKLKQMSILEDFIYENTINDMIHQKKRFIDTSLCFLQMKKEKLYATNLNEGEVLVLTETPLKILNIHLN